MPTISYFYGIVIMMNQLDKEHNPPHIHAFYQDFNATIKIVDGSILEGKLPRKAYGLVKEFVKINKAELLLMWETGKFKKLKGIE